jgi:hypothetical protein
VHSQPSPDHFRLSGWQEGALPVLTDFELAHGGTDDQPGAAATAAPRRAPTAAANGGLLAPPRLARGASVFMRSEAIPLKRERGHQRDEGEEV